MLFPTGTGYQSTNGGAPMRSQRLTQILLVAVGLLLAANLLRPAVTPEVAFAQTSVSKDGVAITGSGQTAWLVKGDKVYYIKFETQFESIRIYGPEDIKD
jgi:hypothetical protein